MNDKNLNPKFVTDIVELCNKEEGEIQKIFLLYNPDTAKLTVLCNYDNKTETEKIGDYDCKPLDYIVILTGVINDPHFITANTKEPANIAVELPSYR